MSSSTGFGAALIVNAAKYHIHDQSSPDDVWTIVHDLGKHPSVTVEDSADSVVIGDVEYLDDDTLTVTFSSAFAGKAYLV